MTDKLVLVSGVSGYLGSHVAKQLQEHGYRVRGTVRSVKNEQKVKHLYNLCPNARHRLELVEADLLDADSWPSAVKGCDFVLHVASPFPMAKPKHEDDLVKPAVEGTLNVLRAVAAAGTVKRVVVTSSYAAIASKGGNAKPYTEADWTQDNNSISAYYKSKLRAERAAWNFVKDLPHGQGFELSTVNPTFILGPPLHNTGGSSVDLIKQLLTNEMPALPRFNFPVVDVRDVALAHVKCMTMEEAAGQRHIMMSKTMWLKDIADILAKEFKPLGYSVPSRMMPNCVVAMASWFNSELRQARSVSKFEAKVDNHRMLEVLGINPIDPRKTLIDMGYALIDKGFVPKTGRYKRRRSVQ